LRLKHFNEVRDSLTRLNLLRSTSTGGVPKNKSNIAHNRTPKKETKNNTATPVAVFEAYGAYQSKR